MKAILLIVALFSDGHYDVLNRVTMASMEACTDSLKNAVQVWLDDYGNALLADHRNEVSRVDRFDNFVLVAQCATPYSKRRPA